VQLLLRLRQGGERVEQATNWLAGRTWRVAPMVGSVGGKSLIVTEFGVGFSEEQQAIPALVGVEDGSQGHPSRVHLRRVPGAETSAPSAKSLWILRLRQAHRQPPGTTQSPQNA
jgi:hypothetical protein